MDGCMNTSLSNKCALVTGASKNIGREIALALAGAGADVILVARTESTLSAVATEIRTQFGVGVEIIVRDLGDQGDLADLERRIGGLDRLDIVVNNAHL